MGGGGEIYEVDLLSKLRLIVALDSPRSFLAVTLYFPASSTYNKNEYKLTGVSVAWWFRSGGGFTGYGVRIPRQPNKTYTSRHHFSTVFNRDHNKLVLLLRNSI